MKSLWFLGLSTVLLLTNSAFAKQVEGNDFKFPVSYDISEYSGKMTFLEFMKTEVFPSLEKVAKESKGRLQNEDALNKGRGVLVKIDDKNLTYHVNFKVH